MPAAKAIETSCLGCGLAMLLAGLVLFTNRPAEATDWSSRSRPIPKVVFKKAEAPRPSTDGWKSQHEKEQSSRNRNLMRARLTPPGSVQHRVRDPFGDQQATNRKPESSKQIVPSSPAGQIAIKGKSTVRPVGQIRNSTFGFVDQESTATNLPAEQVQHPRLKLSFPEPAERVEQAGMTVIEATSYPPVEASQKTASNQSAVVAKYDQSVLAVAGDAEVESKLEDTGAENRETNHAKPAKQPTQQDNKDNKEGREAIESTEGNKIPNALPEQKAASEKLKQDPVPRRSTPAPVAKSEPSEVSILAQPEETENPTATEKPENETPRAAPPIENNLLEDAPQDLTRPRTPPFESLDLYSDEPILEMDSKAIEAEIDAAIAAETNAYDRDCRASREYLLNRTLADISLNIAVSGVPGADFPVSCDIETQKIPLNSYRFSQEEPLNFAWTASGLCHKPLYFREIQAERYGHSIGRVSQPFLSAAHFFCNVAILPYNMGMRPPQECVYALGHYWPGDPAPRYIPAVPISIRGGLMQAGAVLGAVYVLP